MPEETHEGKVNQGEKGTHIAVVKYRKKINYLRKGA